MSFHTTILTDPQLDVRRAFMTILSFAAAISLTPRSGWRSMDIESRPVKTTDAIKQHRSLRGRNYCFCNDFLPIGRPSIARSGRGAERGGGARNGAKQGV